MPSVTYVSTIKKGSQLLGHLVDECVKIYEREFRYLSDNARLATNGVLKQHFANLDPKMCDTSRVV